MPPTAILDEIAERSRRSGIVRRREERIVAGVAYGIGIRYEIDPIIVRVAFVATALLGGAGLIIYLGLWALTPDGVGRIPLLQAIRNRSVLDAGLLLLVLASVVTAREALGQAVVVLIAVLILLLYRSHRQRRDQKKPTSPTGATGLPPAAPDAGPRVSAPAAEPPQHTVEMPVIIPWNHLEHGSAYSSGTHPTGYTAPPRAAVYASAPRTATVVAPPRRPPRRRINGSITLVVLGLSLLAWAASYAIARHHAESLLRSATFGTAAATVFLGLALAAIGMRGYRARFLVLASVVLMTGCLTLGSVPAVWQSTTQWAPTSRTQLQQVYALEVGRAELDLRGLPADQLAGQTVDAKVEAGQLRILVPDDVQLEVTRNLGAGTTVIKDGDTILRRAVGHVNDSQPVVVGQRDQVLRIHATVEVGQIQIERRAR